MTVDPFPTNNAQLRLFIRGIGLIDAQVTQDPAVGVYIARSTGYVTVAIDNLPHADRAVLFGEPRSIGMSLSYRYR